MSSASGNIKIKTATESHGEYSWQTHLIEWRVDGKRFRKKIKDKAEAESFFATKQVELINGNAALNSVATRLSNQQIAQAESAFQRLGEAHSLDDVITYFLENCAPPDEVKGIERAVSAFIEGKEREGLRGRSLKQLESTLGQFRLHAEGLGVESVHEIAGETIENYLRSLRARNGVEKASTKTWNNYRADISSFLSWCSDPRRRWATRNAVEDVHKYKKARNGMIATLSIKESLRIMRRAENFKGGRMVPYFALALFAGIRTDPNDGEMVRLSKREDIQKLIDLKRGVIHLPAEISKTGQMRQIVIRKNLASWLKKYGTDIFPTNHDRDIKEIRKSVGGLAHDVLRHSFITYHVSAYRSIGDAAIEAGNTENVIKKHYLNLATQREGAAFWRIMPKGERLAQPQHEPKGLRAVA